MAKPKNLEQLRAETQLAHKQHKRSVWKTESIRVAIVTRMLNCLMDT